MRPSPACRLLLVSLRTGIFACSYVVGGGFENHGRFRVVPPRLRGVEAKLRAFYERYGRVVVGRARVLLGDGDAANDAFQEVFMRVMTARRTSSTSRRPPPGSIGSRRTSASTACATKGGATSCSKHRGRRPTRRPSRWPGRDARAGAADPEPHAGGDAGGRDLPLRRRDDPRRDRRADGRLAAHGGKPPDRPREQDGGRRAPGGGA